ncbi:MAG TPA: phosphoribosylformylglycinamidine synthase subunit PurL [Thermoanaerobaculaceae bacterium]|nr:phosphoribosylformylglycinamidine synthase subunit PurL [Thermoanaerobaculaceae bacterium]HRS16106.1 phosphoribosylformylglycinamidine synthase subunit PurL [Thermoanaerobaculaceae bacterium]
MRWDAEANAELAREHGLYPEEWERLLEALGRAPNLVELGIFSVLWSEHCSYKSSRAHLRKLPTRGPRVVQGPGENAGVVAVGEGWVAVFKMESHNHPSFIEPYQGAATGVGGILRDVFTMGARPIMLLDSLRFGDPGAPRMRHLVDGVVRGIGDYGNCVGVPTVGGEVDFHATYNGNILVNAMAVGVAREDGIFYGRASGPGNRVVYMGSKTGRDGIHGATMASDVFDEAASAKRPTVQVGDPFTEKLLIECCLELMSRGLVVGIQDMGAAGLTSSSFEMASRAGCGLELDLDAVPVREAGMTPYELMLSESQERMLLIVAPGNVPSVINLCKRWGLDATDIGRVIEEPVVRATFGGGPAFELPIAPLVDEAPRYERPYQRPEPAAPATLPALRDRDWGAELKTLLSAPHLASARRIWEQYDQSVGAATVVGPGADAALVLIPGTRIGLAATTDCNSFACGLDPFAGAAQAVAEAMRNLACVGAEPLGVTDCLNFGSPESPAVMGQFVAAIEGMAEACRALEIPIVSGNVSFYNETSGQSILPTPTIGMVGVVPEVRHVPRGSWELGEALYLLGPLDGELGASRYLQVILGLDAGPVPPVDHVAERRRCRVVAELVRLGLVAATDISDGGLAAALVRMGSPDCGADLTIPWDSLVARVLFGEWLGRFLLAVQPACEPALVQACEGMELHRLGTVGGDRLVVRVGKRIVLSESMAELCALPQRLLEWMEGVQA